MSSTLRIDERYRGPPASGNGGYVAGLLADSLGGSDCVVTLRRPPPLERDLELREDGSTRSLWDGEELIASAEPAVIDLEPPRPPEPAAARAASAGFTGFVHHVFPGCFVCGPDREPGDGLRIFPGPLAEATVAAPWDPSPDLCDPDGRLKALFIWAALDCPGYFAVHNHSGPAVLGRLAVHIAHRPRGDEPLVVVGWHIGSEGRKHSAGTALYAGGRLAATGQAIWVSLAAPLRP